ncbi:hypothetical protein RND81_13G129700 [Saponaria officinalis]
MKNESMAIYFGRMKKLWDDLNDFDQLPACEDRPEPMSFVARAGAGIRGSGGERWEIPTCTHCKKKGHKIDSCYEIVGFPERYSDRSRSGVGNKGRNSYIANPINKNDGSSTSYTQANTVRVEADNGSSVKNADKAALLRISSEQWEQFHNFLHTQNKPDECLTGKAYNECWIIDSGATRHITGNLGLLENVKTINCSPVGLPNGEHIMATKEGDVHIRGNFTLKDVLYVPNFT